MAYIRRGMGEDCAFPYLSTTCVKTGWNWLFPGTPQVVAPPPIPSGSYGEQVFPAAGSSGGVTLPTTGTPQDVIDEAVNQQLADQQALNAGQVQGSLWWDIEGAAASTGDAITSAVTSPLLWFAVGLGVFALVAVSGGSPRRYGR